MTEVVVTGIGIVSSIGTGKAEVESSLRELRHGFECWSAFEELGVAPKVAATVDGFDVSSINPGAWSWPDGYDLDPVVVRAMPPHGIYSMVAMQEALAQSGLDRDDLGDGETGLACASGGSMRLLHSHLSKSEASGWRRYHPLGVVSTVAGTLNFNFGPLLGIRGTSCGFVSACTSSSHALGAAFDEIMLGRQERMIVIGAEDFTVENLLPFAGMGALSLNPDPDTASRPFDRGRDGFVGTGGAAVLVLESAAVAKARGAKVLANMLGWAQASDGYHAAKPHPEGEGLARALQKALNVSGITAGEVDYINAHATSTVAGDIAEAKAVRTVFGDACPPLSSTKALTGHGLSLAGALEASISLISMGAGITPGQAGLAELDENCKHLNLPSETLEEAPGVMVNSNSGFGGGNVCHVFANPD
ncbi:MAG: 3-oxoacyl-[acyl-carrier-protein] synthase-1 [Verrucomicrobiales bacterium]|jgi:3-oxoacyl-[acyl-carrier-protein] synthase-1